GGRSQTGPSRRPPGARYRWNGSPIAHAEPTSTLAESPTWPQARFPASRRARALRWIEYSSSCSLCLAGLISHNGNEQVGDAGRAYVAKGGELLTIGMIEL